jgi:hypothetical protein
MERLVKSRAETICERIAGSVCASWVLATCSSLRCYPRLAACPSSADSTATAPIEGWGLYAESLGSELGLYQDPASKYGQLAS